MEVDLALAIVRQKIAPECLNRIQEEVFVGAWKGLSYYQIAQAKGYDPDYLRGIGAGIWHLLSTATGQKITKRNFKTIIEQLEPITDNFLLESNLIDWQTTIDVSAFYGREGECEQLSQWIVQDRCRLVAILGMGGIGKSSLAIKMAQELQSHFQSILWRSLLNAPPLKELLADLIHSLRSRIPGVSEGANRLPTTVKEQVGILLTICQQERCLIILDNGESILQQGTQAGQYRADCTDYGYLLRMWGQVQHRSCLLLTSREKPTEIGQLEGVVLPVRTKLLSGLAPKAGQQIFADKGCLPIEPTEWAEIDRYYGGNPLALQLVAAAVQELAGGDIREILPYLRSEKLGLVDIGFLLEQQWERLTPSEKQVMYWLAIHREPMSLEDLETALHPTWNHQAGQHSIAAGASLLTALQSLRRRSIIEYANRHRLLQPVVMEYVTSKLVSEIGQEIESQQPYLLNTHALLEANNKAYIRQAQIRLIVQPTIDTLLSLIGDRQLIINHLQGIVNQWQGQKNLDRDYLAGNIINLLCNLGADLTGWDFSRLVIRQADLVGQKLSGVNFAHSQIVNCTFTQAFSTVLSVVYSPSGDRLATSDSNGAIRIWRVADGQCLLTCTGHTNWVRAVRFSPDGRYLLSTSDDLTMKLWDLEDGICLRTIGSGIYHITVCFAPTGRTIVSGSTDGQIYCWDVVSGDLLKSWKVHEHWVMRVNFHPQGERLVTASADSTVKIWEYGTGESLHTLTGHENWVMNVVYSPDGNQLVSSGMDSNVRIWDANTGARLHLLQGHDLYVWSVAFSPDGQIVASAGVDRTIRLWRTRDGHCLRSLEGHTKQIWWIDFHPHGGWLASGGDDQTIRIWQLSDGKCLQVISGYTNAFRSIAWSRDGQRLITGSQDAVVRVWDRSGEICLQQLSGHSNLVTSIAVHPRGLTWASGGEDRTIRIWDTQTDHLIRVVRGHTEPIWSLAYSPSGDDLASAGSECTIRIWQIVTGKCLHLLGGHRDRISALAYHPRQPLLASASEDQTVKVWNTDRGELVFTFTAHYNRVVAVAFSPCGALIASGGMDSQILVWDVETGQIVSRLIGHKGWILSLAFSPDGQWLIAGDSEYTIQVWSMATGECLTTARGHEGWVRSVAVSPCGQIIASAGDDGTIRLWDLATGNNISTRRAPRPYEGMNITELSGLTKAQIETLKTLGAITS
jgi:WD40 repeat protein